MTETSCQGWIPWEWTDHPDGIDKPMFYNTFNEAAKVLAEAKADELQLWCDEEEHEKEEYPPFDCNENITECILQSDGIAVDAIDPDHVLYDPNKLSKYGR